MTGKGQSLFPLAVKLCSDKAAFEARPKCSVSINMDMAEGALKMSDDHEIIVATPHIIIVRSGKAEVTLSRNGRMLVKKVLDQDEALRVARQVLRTIKVALKS